MAIDDVVLLLANSAEQPPGGMISALGIGWSITTSPTALAALLMFIKVPWDLTNVRHKVQLDLLTQDGEPATVDGGPVSISLEFEAGRPVGLLKGQPIDWAQAVNISPLNLPPGRFAWQMTVNGEPKASRPFTVRNPTT